MNGFRISGQKELYLKPRNEVYMSSKIAIDYNLLVRGMLVAISVGEGERRHAVKLTWHCFDSGNLVLDI